jgi:hypothetical protein
VRTVAVKNVADRALDGDIHSVLCQYRAGRLPVGELDFG